MLAIKRGGCVLLCAALAWAGTAVGAENKGARAACRALPDHSAVQQMLAAVVAAGGNGGLGNEMWGTVVNRDGVVCAIAFSGADRASQWPGSRVISAQKANTANAFSLEGNYPNVGLGRALASGNVYGLVQPGGSLFGLQFSNPVNPGVAYRGNPRLYGQPNDPMVGRKIGGVNVFGGGLPLYDDGGRLIGGLGVSGDTSCADHIIAWKVRDGLELDNIPGGVAAGGTDNLVLPPVPGDAPAVNSFEHPFCGFGEEAIIPTLPAVGNYPPGPNP
ncbi:MAG: GlcG/HbpS family heme-binding protein [Gammaproteobacteria bacterium]